MGLVLGIYALSGAEASSLWQEMQGVKLGDRGMLADKRGKYFWRTWRKALEDRATELFEASHEEGLTLFDTMLQKYLTVKRANVVRKTP